MVSAFIILGFIGLFIVIIALVTYTSYQDRQRRTDMAQELAFTPVEPDQALLERIMSVHITQRDISRNRLYNVMRRSIPYGTMYFYDLMHTGGKSSSLVESGAIAIVSPNLALPSFNVLPRLSTGGALANMANQFIEGVLTMQGLNEIDFPDTPELDEKFFITGEDEEAIRALFTPALAAQVLKMPLVTILGKGDTLSVGRTNQLSAKQDLESLRELMAHASAVFDCISRP